MTFTRGLFIHPDATRGTTALEARQALAGLITTPGVLDGLRVTGTAGWQYSVPAGHVATSRGSDTDGMVLFGNDAPVLVDCPPAPGTGARIDIIYAKHNDATSPNADPNAEAFAAVAEGIATGTPTAPELPEGAVELGRATVGAGATSTAHANVTIDHSQAPKAEIYRNRAIVGSRYGSTTATSIPNNTPTMVSPGNVGDYQGISGAPSGIRIDTPGWYMVTAGVKFSSNTDGARELYITRNGDENIGSERHPGYSNDAITVAARARYYDAGDVLQMWVVQNSGGNLNLNPGQGNPYLSVAFVGA